MYAITGITGKVDGALARRLLAASQPVRSVVLSHGYKRVEQRLADRSRYTWTIVQYRDVEPLFDFDKEDLYHGHVY